MTSEIFKTNEFLRRRKLRLQQVREQSKDIAKNIRLRAKSETLRQVVNLDAQKQKEYFERQEKLVKRLEELYERNRENVGTSHQSASELTQGAIITPDISKLRGKEAAANLRKKRQEVLDEQKKLLDRRLRAREAANELSREKSSVVANKLHPKTAVPSAINETALKSTEVVKEQNNNEENNKDLDAVTKNDVGTQWDIEPMSHEEEPDVPTLTFPVDDQGSIKDTKLAKNIPGKSNRIDLFALSKEMPSDLRGSLPLDSTEISDRIRPSLTLVTEYLQSRKLRLRETDVTQIGNRHPDISGLKQTILRSRSSKLEGRNLNVCHVLDEQIIPTPSWQAAKNYKHCTPNVASCKKSIQDRKQYNTVSNSQINRIFSSIRGVKQHGMVPSPILRSTSPFRRNKISPRFFPSKSNVFMDSKPESMHKKNSVVVYNHSTRDTKDMPQSEEHLVVRDLHTEDDAYSQAIRQSSTIHEKDNHQKEVQDIRNKVAVTKQNVEKEYRDTINFLNSLPKNKTTKVTKTAYMDERRQQMQTEKHQQKMQHEYRKIEKECKKHHSCMKKKGHSSKSPLTINEMDEDFNNKDYQYSWMPVPESDGNLVIHTIPNTVKESKTDNTVKFSNVDSYHEYRSRHKHTPPTKDTESHDKYSNKKRVEAIIVDKNDSTDESASTISESCSVENLQLNKASRKAKPNATLDQNLSDAERIIIYKILDTKTSKTCKKNAKILNDIAKSLTSIEKVQKSAFEDNELSQKLCSRKEKSVDNNIDDPVVIEQINEGVYKVQEDKGDNVSENYYHPETNKWGENTPQTKETTHKHKKLSEIQQRDKGSFLQWQDGDDYQPKRTSKHRHCSTSPVDCEAQIEERFVPTTALSAAPCTSTFKTVIKDKVNNTTSEADCIKLVDEAGQEAGKLFLGGQDFLKENAYEVVIQLRKKDCPKVEKSISTNENPKQTNNRNKSANSLARDMVNTENTVPTKSANLEDCRINEASVYRNVLEDESHINSPRKTKHLTQTEKTNEVEGAYQNSLGTESSVGIRLAKSSEEKNEVADKATSIQYDLPTEVEPPSRPATTTYTQTTNSPIHRPVYLHMSSSTSTAYMSPPDMILPQYLKHDIKVTGPKSARKSSKHIITKTIHSRKGQCKKNIILDEYENSQHINPPNNTRRCVKHRHYHVDTSQYSNSTSPKIVKSKEKKCKCRHYKCEALYANNLRKLCHSNLHIPSESYKMSQNCSAKNIATKNKLASKNKLKRHGQMKNHSSDSLNPIIKNYINKLLTLNREGIKALEVGEQECSSVATPNSSVINVPYNLNDRKTSIQNNLSLEHIKNLLMRQVIGEHIKNISANNNNTRTHTINKNILPRKSQRKVLHKVKTVNISKHFIRKQNTHVSKAKDLISQSTSTDDNNKISDNIASKSQKRSLRSPATILSPSTSLSTYEKYNSRKMTRETNVDMATYNHNGGVNSSEHNKNKQNSKYPSNKNTTTDISTELTKESQGYYRNKSDIPINISTQTCQNMDSDYMKLAEDKLNNMEKIADLTEKCTKRLSSLAKVLEEVRKNKSLVYSHITGSDSADSQSDHTSEKVVQCFIPTEKLETSNKLGVKSPETFQMQDKSTDDLELEMKSNESNSEEKTITAIDSDKAHSEYISFLSDIPKPGMFKLTEPNISKTSHSAGPSPLNTDTSTINLGKFRPKPPPALSRIHLKHDQEYIVPHELSTVLEVDSPMSVITKKQSSRNDIPNYSSKSNDDDDDAIGKSEAVKGRQKSVNPDLLQLNAEIAEQQKISRHESLDDSKFQMIDLKHFNEIMLEPFVSIHEYAKKCNIAELREESNHEDHKDHAVNDDISSLHSDGSLPDVIAELLKRNVITEPFKFDTGSNINSTTMSSESTLSMLALSKVRKNKKKSNVTFKNKENMGETSDTLSISSNPDLENALQRLGMGWASSTLKKTKERLALSSSSNTSSSSLSQLKIRSFNQDIPALVTDSVSSVLLSKKILQNKNLTDNSKSTKQQTNFTNSMTVKEFLANELANKITFTSNKSGINDTEDEFASLFVTKMPEAFKQQSQTNNDDHSHDSIPSGANRARTSTPVQLFKSMTYHSSSCSNVSNGLFSNADDLSSVKMTSNSMKNHSTSEKDNLTIPGVSLKIKKGSDSSRTD